MGLQGGKVEKATKFDKISTLVFMLLGNAFSDYMNFITNSPKPRSKIKEGLVQAEIELLGGFGHPNVCTLHACNDGYHSALQ